MLSVLTFFIDWSIEEVSQFIIQQVVFLLGIKQFSVVFEILSRQIGS